MPKSLSRKKYGFSYNSNEKKDEFADLGYRNSLRLLTSDHLLEVTVLIQRIVLFPKTVKQMKQFVMKGT